MAGIRAAEVLRSEGFDGRLVVVDGDQHALYDKPPLSKAMLLGTLAPDRIALRRPEAIQALGLELRHGVMATGLDTSARRLTTSDGDHLDYDGLILATGSVARTVAAWSALEGVITVRTMADSLRLRAMLNAGPRRVVIIGAGFIGLEIAAISRKLGLEVTVVEPLSAPVVRGLGEQMGGVVASLHRQHGVDLHLGIGVDRLDGSHRVEAVQLSDGSVVGADVVVVGIGAGPSTTWLDESGLVISDGIVCDETLWAGVTGVFAAGDVVRWPHGLYDETIRIEHWTNAAEQGEAAARNLVAQTRGEVGQAYEGLPFFWSDQYDRKIQFLGRAGADDEVRVVAGDPADHKLVALYRRGNRLIGALGMSMPKALMAYRRLLLERISWDDALAFAASQN